MYTIRKFIGAYLRMFQFRINIRLTRDKLKKYGPRAKGRILDIGAGDQPYRRFFSNASEYVATNARGHYAPDEQALIENNTDVWLDDATHLPFDDASFDGVLCFQVLSLIREPRRFFIESARILKPGGVLFLTTDFLYPKWDDEDVMRHTDRHLRDMAETAGFEVETIESFGGLFTMINCNISRYIRDYPQRITEAKNPLVKLWRMFMLCAYLGITPLYSIGGWIVYLRERGVTNRFDYSTNMLLIARKKAD